ncbi:MAG: S8 family serine peptidase [Actinomycetota bacterium]|nr:S8 family serine peptidase [Actinomycetota bacterium]
MPSATRPIPLAVRALLLSLGIACSFPAAATAAVVPAKGEGPLSPPLLELARPAVASKPAAAQAERLGVPRSGPGSLVRKGEKVLVTARLAAESPLTLDALREAGAQIVSSSRSTRTATLAIAPERLRALAAVRAVRSVWQVREPLVRAVEGPCEGGSVISEGVGQLRVDEAREAFELRGKGITIGVLSDSFDTAEESAEPPPTTAVDDEVSNDIPGPAGSCSDQQLRVNVLDEGPEGESDEGRAMLQILHDLAPHASLAFATAFESEESFAQNIERLAEPISEEGAEADVIVDDVAWFEEPFFQDGPVAVAIDKVTAAGASYFSAAGNDNLFDAEGNEISSWEAPEFRDSGLCPSAIVALPGINGSHCMDFDPGVGVDTTFGITVEAGETLTVDLQWAEPWNDVDTDLDAFLLSAGGAVIAESIEDNASATGTQRPVEILQWENTAATARTVRLAINRFSGADPRLKFIFLQNGGGVSGIEYPESSGGDVVGPAIYGHAGAASAISTAAVPFNNSNVIEPYSSRGPVTHYFGPVEGASPAPPLGSPEVVAKPDLAATDCGANTFFGFFALGAWRFCGTSAAAPHAAAVAALVRQADPTSGEQEVREVLADTAVPVGAFSPEATGAGLVDAFAAIDSLPGPIAGGDGPSEVVPPLEEPEEPPVNPNPPSGENPPPVTPPVGPLPQPSPAAPGTSILQRPPALVRTRARAVRLVFRFGSNQGSVSFLCKVDRSPYRPCPRRFARRYSLGKHVLRVKARGAGGLLDPTPATFRFRVARF